RLYMTFLRNRTQDLPDTVVGLHWFEDRLYAVAGEGDEAQLYYSVDEFTSQEEGISRGWHALDPGLFVEFEKGYSPSDSLTTYSRAYATQEADPRPSPTPTTGNSGAALNARQGVSIPGDISQQARGWKPNTAPTTYDISASDVRDNDSSYVYADATYQWLPNVDTVNVQGGYRSSQLSQPDPAYRIGGVTVGGTTSSREFGASNAYTTLVLEGIEDLGENLPINTVVEGLEVEVDYSVELLTYANNVGDDTTPTEDAAFDILNNLSLKASILKGVAGSYTRLGAGSVGALPIDKSEFSLQEEGTKDSGAYEWHVYSSDNRTMTIGGPNDLFGNNLPTYADLVATFGLGLSVEPTVGSKPSYANRGAAAYRVKINKVRIKVYFQRKSSFYYI